MRTKCKTINDLRVVGVTSLRTIFKTMDYHSNSMDALDRRQESRPSTTTRGVGVGEVPDGG